MNCFPSFVSSRGDAKTEIVYLGIILWGFSSIVGNCNEYAYVVSLYYVKSIDYFTMDMFVSYCLLSLEYHT